MNHQDDGRIDARPRSTRDARRRPRAVAARRLAPESAAVDVYRDLGTLGLSSAEAGNLTAYLRGIRPVERGWTVAEIERLLFLRYLVERGRIGS